MFTANERIQEIVSRQPSAGGIFHRFDIDPGTNAADTVAETCSKLQLSVEQVLERLEEAELRGQSSAVPDVSGYSLTRLIQYVVRIHHRYAREQLPWLTALARDVRETENAHAPELDATVGLLDALRAAMVTHFEGEEQVLFPYIARLDENTSLADAPACGGIRGLAAGVFVMAQEHELVAHLLVQLQLQTHGFAVPDGASVSYVSLMTGLRAFKFDLERHLELEDGLLFPRALARETGTIVTR